MEAAAAAVDPARSFLRSSMIDPVPMAESPSSAAAFDALTPTGHTCHTVPENVYLRCM